MDEDCARHSSIRALFSAGEPGSAFKRWLLYLSSTAEAEISQLMLPASAPVTVAELCNCWCVVVAGWCWWCIGCGVSDCGGHPPKPNVRLPLPPPWLCCRMPAVEAGRWWWRAICCCCWGGSKRCCGLITPPPPPETVVDDGETVFKNAELLVDAKSCNSHQ